MRWAGYVARMGETTNEYDILVGKHEETARWHKRGWRGNIKMDIKEIGWEGV